MAAGGDIPFACRCGQVTGRLVATRAADGTHALCHCNDCRGAVMHLGEPDPRPRGVGYFQTTPDRVRFDTGTGNLAVFSLREGTLLRWYASCCNAPLFNTVRSPKVPFASLYTSASPDPAVFGRIKAEAFIPKPNGKQGFKGAHRFALGMLTRSLPARLSGRWRQTPFFDTDTLKPVVTPTVLTAEDRAAVGLR